MKTVIFVGGASASGKSTFVKELNKKIPESYLYRRVQAFFDFASYKNIPIEETFKYITSSDADNWFFETCISKTCLISDVHYALQMDRNFKEGTQDVNIFQEYVPTLSLELISRMLSENIRVIAIHINCSTDVLYNRAIERKKSGEREVRAISLHDVKIQQFAEREEWLKISNISGVESFELDSTYNCPNLLADEFIFELNSKKKLTLSSQRDVKLYQK